MKLYITESGDCVDCEPGSGSLSEVNRIINDGNAAKLIAVAESWHERKYAQVADAIAAKGGVRLVLLAGPSSSGKTTTARRIALQCRVLGMNPIVMGMDDYFVDKDKTPKDENGKYDFEAPEAVNLELLSSHVNDLFAGKEVELRKYDFVKGKNISSGRRIRMGGSDIIVMEGIHALNPAMIEKIDSSRVFRVFASTMTPMGISGKDDIQPSDFRLLRRILRDHRTRGITPESNIIRWSDVMSGEHKHITPFRGNADAFFDSTLVYELSVLKCYLEPLLRRIPSSSPAFGEAGRLLGLLDDVCSVMPDTISFIPASSIIREFIGGSLFEY